MMSALEIYALYGAPLLMAAAGLAVYLFAMRGAKQNRPPAE
jgi:hypothetical protein